MRSLLSDFDCESIVAASSALTSGEHARFSLVIRNRHVVCIYVSTFERKHHISQVMRDLFSWGFRKKTWKINWKEGKGGPLKCRVMWSSPLSRTSFTVKPQRLIKRSLNLLPEMMLCFPETLYKKLDCKSSLMSASAVWTSFLLKNYGCVPGWFHEDISVTDWEFPQGGLPASLDSRHLL